MAEPVNVQELQLEIKRLEDRQDRWRALLEEDIATLEKQRMSTLKRLAGIEDRTLRIQTELDT